MSNLHIKYPYRVEADARAIVESVGPNTVKDDALKKIGMRNVRVRTSRDGHIFSNPGPHHSQNALWDIANTDVHEAVSFDRLHAYIIGLWKQHLFEELKEIIIALGREVQVEFEAM